MLKEEQAAALLTRCETIIGKKLSDVQRKLQQPDARSATVWELLVIEAASQIGTVEYEPHPGGSLDIRLHLPHGRPIWLEVAFLYPRFWKEERKSEAVLQWIFQEVKRRAIPPWKIQYRLDGDRKNTAGPVWALPDLHERKRFLKDSGISKFFDNICSALNDQHVFSSSQYSIALSYTPNASGPYSSGGGLLQESSKTIKEHALYKVLKRKKLF